VELAELYDEGHEIEPILVVLDPGGVFWIADGFHRLEAQRRLGRGSVKAIVRDGPAATLDMAKMLAAEANKNGRPLQAGDKRRAVLMARSTLEGAKMGVRELARHCGVTKSYVGEVLAQGCPVPDTPSATRNRSEASAKGAANRHATLYMRIDSALQADASRPDTHIAEELGCDSAVVGRRRAALGLPKSDTSKWRQSPSRDAAEQLLREHPEWTNGRIATETKSAPETVSRLREKLGLPRRRRGPVPKVQPPSAPVREGDPRDAAEVIPLRPAAPTSGYSSAASRDTAKAALHALDDVGRRMPAADIDIFCDEGEAFFRRLRGARGAA